MSDYTPTTDVIHAAYLACTDWESWATYEGKNISELSKERDAEFDRWLAEVKAQEREKVIELIRRQAEGSELESDQKAVTLYEGLIAFIYIQNPYRQGKNSD